MTFRPMLASEADLAKLRFPLFASPKLDGIRATVVDGRLLTRTLKEVPNRHVFNLLSNERFNGLDGELIVGSPTAHDVYRQTVSGVMSIEGEPGFRFYVFDDYHVPYRWLERWRAVIGRGNSHWHDSFVLHHHDEVRTHDELLEVEERALSAGYEGLILRDPSAPYKFGRSTAKEGYLLKLKRFQDSEAEVLEVIEEMANLNEAKTNALGRTERSSAKAGKVGKGTMGALRVRDLKTGVEFEIGTGFTAEDRAKFWRSPPIGQTIKFKHFPIGNYDKPRHPVFIGFRPQGA